MTTTTTEKHEFQAEVKQLLDIVIHSLYTDKEIFVRELISNASDALEKLRHTQITEKEIFDDKLDLEIKISSDDKAGTVTIQDFGVGMTHDELVKNLGTIAHSGSKAFLEAVKSGGGNNENLIGQFGVGFYSAFMVADEVAVYTHSWKEGEKGYCWKSQGAGEYEIEEVEGQRRGCKIVIKLKEDCKEFANESQLKRIVSQYSSFVGFPVKINDERINTVEAIWLKSKNDLTDEQYKEFYKFQAKAFDEPMSWLHFSADAPIVINSLLYIPSENMEKMGFGRLEPSVALHCRKVLIDGQPKGLLPEWMRFVKGVIDSADLPLNISRETMQDSALVQKISKVMSKRFLKHVEEMSRKDEEGFKKFWNTFSHFIKEGVTSDYGNREQLSKLMRFESSTLEKGQWTTLGDYVSRMKEGQNEIYYLTGASRESLEAAPYLEAFKARGLEVLFMYEGIDDFVISNLMEFEGKRFVSADTEDIKLDELAQDASKNVLSEKELKEFCEWMKGVYGKERVSDVKVGERLVDSPVMVLNSDKMLSISMRRMMKMMNQEVPGQASVSMEINPRHALIKHIEELRVENETLAKKVAEQVLDNALISAGLLEDPRDMVKRVYELLEQVNMVEK